MEKINFENSPSIKTPINATNLNLIQTNVENAINESVESGSNENGNWIKYIDGTLIQYGNIDKTEFMISQTTSSIIQNLTIYRSKVIEHYFPIKFVDTNYVVHFEVSNAASGSRVIIPRIAGDMYTVARIQMQLLGLEDFIEDGAAYTNLSSVKWLAIGRWK